MRRASSRFTVHGLVGGVGGVVRVIGLLLALGAPCVARADRIDDLGDALANDPSFKVRLQAALTLGRLGDARAVPPLVDALRDDHEMVRAMAVQSLALLGDARALAPLQGMRRDQSPLVRMNVDKVLPALEASLKKAAPEPPPPPLPPPPRNARFFLTTSMRVKGAPDAAQRKLNDLTLRALGQLPRVAVTLPAATSPPAKGARKKVPPTGSPAVPAASPPTDPASRGAVPPTDRTVVPIGASALPTAQQLAAARLIGFVVEGTLTVTLSRAPVELGCGWSGVLATFPERAIKASSTATMAVPGARRLDDRFALDQCLDAAAGVIAQEVAKFLKAQK